MTFLSLTGTAFGQRFIDMFYYPVPSIQRLITTTLVISYKCCLYKWRELVMVAAANVTCQKGFPFCSLPYHAAIVAGGTWFGHC